MRFQLLGPVEAYGEQGRLDLSASKLRTVLAVLLLARGKVVSDSTLVEMLWDEQPPATAEAQIQTYVSRLRQKMLSTVEIVRQRPGYLLHAPDDQLDLDEFESLAGHGRAALNDGRPDQAATMLRDALSVWQGPALGGVTEHLALAERPWLEESRLAALEGRIDADLLLGRQNSLVSELTGLVTAHPLRERLRGQLMLTLYRNGRQAGALASYQDYRALLAAELGIDPGQELRDLYQQVLVNDPALDGPPTEPMRARQSAGHSTVEHVPEQLPLRVSDFIGRKHEVDRVRVLLDTSSRQHGRMSACVVAGMAGVGKTALIVHVAHQLREAYPDGQLYAELGGTREIPVDPGDVLADMLVALGTARAEIPVGTSERSRLYRERLSGKRILVLLDDVADEQQVRPLLPADPGSGMLLTSRARLTGLESVRLIDLDVLSCDEAVALLTKIVGNQRVAAELDAARDLVKLCGHLPLGVRIAGARLAAKPHWPLAEMVIRLGDQRSRLDELRLADLEVRASVMLSYDSLSPKVRRAFRLLSLLEARPFGIWTAAVALDVSVAEARELLEELVDARLLEAAQATGSRQTRYVFHDLVRLLALERMAAEETHEQRFRALSRTRTVRH
jgi:DNA-binding SARP family transcriptional activator